MYYLNGEYFELTLKQKITYFFISLAIISFGNGLSIAAQLGAAPWSASAVNLANVTHLPTMLFLAIEAILAAVINLFMVEKINWRRAIGNVIFGLLFSLFVAEFANLFHPLLAPLSLIPKLIVDLFGIWCIGIGISVIQRANFVLHPLDNLTNVARFKFFRGSAPLGQLSNFIFAVTISLICWALSGKLLSYGIGTIYCFFLQGNNIAWGDKHLFKHLLHIDPTKI
ncbi:hypothetical protein R5P91_05215 [Oenococcus oeni]|uniref:Membrane protein n=1 Tax=Oenococcus oeni ATCC BAA-1163 TaxID=379360 RepID=A0NKH7_OENOE|nr:membrane protein [Oenococcus oeni]EAV39030.1 membrane protein [Oenococcus oeni ATCC BAA-1163]MDI4583642.1 hypothetical protein [Oenococcus sp. UCMA 14587]EJO03364.1 hypothetical protein AWRIB418_195 [Oenococcus oeni AWRIB418]EJO04943.1 hypothetical protein AWRIB548_1251 [Oenococcus oeni AWRIB548]EJO08131.1 hypothetical protein AWRIB422_231 [Oenococcus oeni AWRIB422]